MSRASLLRSTFAMVTGRVLQRTLGFVITVALARLLDPAGFGAYAFTQSTSQTAYGMARLGVDAGLHIRLARAGSDARETAALVGQGATLFLILAALGGLTLAALAEPIASQIYAAPELAPFVTIAAALFAGQALAQGAYVGFAGLHRFPLYARLFLIGSIASAAFVIGGAAHAGAKGAAIGLACGQAVAAIVLMTSLFRILAAEGLTAMPQRPGRLALSVFTLGLPFYGSGLFMIPAEFVSQGAVSRFAGVDALGELRVVLALMAVVQILPQALAGPMISYLSEREGSSAGAGVAVAYQHARTLWVLALVGVVGLATVWPFVVTLAFGHSYALARGEGELALVPFVPTIVGTALTGALLAGGNSRPLFLIGAVQGAVLVGVAWPLIQIVGLPGLFAGQAASAAVAVILWFLALGQQVGRPALRRWMVPLSGLFLAISALIVGDVLIEETIPVRLAVATAALAIVLTVAWFGAYTAHERRYLSHRLKSHRYFRTGDCRA